MKVVSQDGDSNDNRESANISTSGSNRNNSCFSRGVAVWASILLLVSYNFSKTSKNISFIVPSFTPSFQSTTTSLVSAGGDNATAGMVAGGLSFLKESTPSVDLPNTFSSSLETTKTPESRSHGLSAKTYPKACAGKERLLEILLAAQYENITAETCTQLPTWKEVSDLYGPSPVIYGLDTCGQYRSMIESLQPNDPKGEDEHASPEKILPKIRVSGFCNTGTNALTKTLRKNIGLKYANSKKYHIKNFDVPWGKHQRVIDRNTNRGNIEGVQQVHNKNYDDTNYNLIFPIILVRDPYRWISSMCKMRYIVTDLPNYGDVSCWQFVEEEEEQQQQQQNHTKPFKPRYNIHVNFQLGGFSGGSKVPYDSLASLWNEWYYDYIFNNNNSYRKSDVTPEETASLASAFPTNSSIGTSQFPRLVIRYEDMIFHASQVIDTIMNCIGIQPYERKGYNETTKKWDFIYQTNKAKSHGNSVDLLQAMVKYGSLRGRKHTNFRNIDLLYLQQTLHPKLMETFHYSYV